MRLRVKYANVQTVPIHITVPMLNCIIVVMEQALE